jgi:hypothetical protein
LFSCIVCYTICHYHITRKKSGNSGNLRFPEPLPLYGTRSVVVGAIDHPSYSLHAM